MEFDHSDGGMRKRSIAVAEAGGRRGTIHVDELNNADRALAEKYGYKPVFKREFGYLSTFSFAVSISGLFSTIATTFVYPLEAGGAASAVWCWLISGLGCMCIAASVAELVSAYPTSGGLYYTVSRLAPRDWVPSISWITGWLNLLGQVAGLASSEFGSAQLLCAAVSIASGHTVGSDGTITFNWSPSAGILVGVMAGLTVLCGLLNTLSTYWMEKMTKSYVIVHLFIIVSCVIALLVHTPSEYKHSASYVFTHTSNDSGWSPSGFAFLFGFLSVSWTMTDYDATAHITEEIREPEIKAPWAIFLAMLVTYLGGFLFNIVLCFVMGDPDVLLSSNLGQPVSLIFLQSLGKGGAITFTVCALVILQFVCFTAMQALGRTLFAFSRDRLVPLNKWWVKILPLTGTPVLAVWCCVVLCIAINLIALGNYVAIEGVFNVTAIALDWSYCIPIFCKIVFGKFEPGPWTMGKYGKIVNIWACTWTAFVSIIFIFPTIRPVTADNMNYAIAFLGLIFFAATVFWFVSGKRYYTGPIIEAEVVDGDIADSSSADEREKETVAATPNKPSENYF